MSCGCGGREELDVGVLLVQLEAGRRCAPLGIEDIRAPVYFD
ncbi:hypothetical protein WMF38_01025 [Sorangium sp. So ce118]